MWNVLYFWNFVSFFINGEFIITASAQPLKVITLKTALLLNTGKKHYGQPLQTII